jgi:diacylglycerol kinase family enzyme
MLCAYLLASEPNKSEREIIETVQSIRTTARLNKKQLKRLLSLSKYIKEHRPPTLSLIINPVSGGGKWAYYDNHVLGILTQRYALNCYFTEESTNVSNLIQSTTPDGPHTFVACGGDGTVAQVAAAIKNTHHTLAILPMGTANAMAHVLFGLASKVDPFNCACNALLEHHAAPMDTLECNGKTALLVVALGIEEKMITHADRNLKNQHGQLAYIQGFMEALLDSKPLDVQMQVDNHEAQSISSSSLAIANAAPATTLLAQGGGIPDWQDGLFDITLLKYQSDTSKKLLSLAELLSNSLSQQSDSFHISHQQGKAVEISAAKPFHYCIDGEIDQATKLNIELLPRSLSIIVPS